MLARFVTPFALGVCLFIASAVVGRHIEQIILLLTVYFGTPSMFIALWFVFDYGTNPPLGTLII
jgi:hypothetical protein